ncbi:hypothetical protein J437_LFUL012896 [Ladona fulva]|uniref:C2H2-type domain-containing protein n=1 Tax=Ladona fulva TaxID=123851 RepID=A0A8K0KCH3_LADFU|nr:hypothetical protein J437_LFUL012896 [Ladona fulva]
MRHCCPICNKAFSRLDHLRTVHMRVHEPWRSAVSKTSEKTFKSSADSDGVNQSKSLGEKCRSNKQENFACEKCSKTFSTKAKLEKHLVLHSGHKAYKCSTCGRSFALASYLSAHRRTHEKQQAYLQCPKCPRRFVSQETLSVSHFCINFNIRLNFTCTSM